MVHADDAEEKDQFNVVNRNIKEAQINRFIVKCVM